MNSEDLIQEEIENPQSASNFAEAKHLLWYYVSLNNPNVSNDSDCKVEVEAIVDEIVEGLRKEMKAEIKKAVKKAEFTNKKSTGR